jgi:3-hydroxybutyryl-CoA dehydrogenase
MTIGVAGVGFLGRGIAACLLIHGHRVVGFTPDAGAFAGVRKYIQDAVDEMPECDAGSWSERYIETQSLKDFAECEFVIESVLEDLAIKSHVFDELEAVVASDVPIASNTSALPISSLQAARKHPERFLGMHWAQPAYATRFMELIRGEQTGDDAFEKAVALARSVGKDPAIVRKDVPGFIINRLGYAMYREALHLLESGVADVESIDRAFNNALGLWATFCGPFRWIDITGGPALYAKAMKGVLPTLSNAAEVPKAILDAKSFYEYTPEERAYWEALLHRRAWSLLRLQEEQESERQSSKGTG